MTPDNRFSILGRIKARFKEYPKNVYYKMCVDHNDIFCIKCKCAICDYEELVGKHGLGKRCVWNYYHGDCFERLYL